MITRLYCVDRLHSNDAKDIARIEKAIYPVKHRVGSDVIWAQLAEAESDGENLSLGLFFKGKLVGFVLLFVLKERSKVCEYFDVKLPAGMAADEPVMYIADVGVLPEHRKANRLFSRRLLALLNSRPYLRNLCLDAFATEERTEFWTSRVRLITGFGWVLRSKMQVEERAIQEPTYWLSFAPTADSLEKPGVTRLTLESVQRVDHEESLEVGVVRSIDAWAALEPYWDKLLRQSPMPTVLQSYVFLRTWWSHFEFASDPFIVVVLRNRIPIGIAPLHVTPGRRLGNVYRCLTSISEFTGTADFLISSSVDSSHVLRIIAQFIAMQDKYWDYISLTGTHGALFLCELQLCLRKSGHFTVEIPCEARALDTLPIEDPSAPTGRIKVVSSTTSEIAKKNLEDYLRVEQSHAAAPVIEFRLPTSAILAFCRDLARQCSETMQLHMMYWLSNDKVVSAGFGLVWNQTFYPLRSLSNATHHRIAKIPFECASRDTGSSQPLIFFKASHRTPTGMLLHFTHFLAHPSIIRIRRRLARWLGKSDTAGDDYRAHSFQMFRW